MGNWIQRASMPTARHDLQAIAVGGMIYAIAGADDKTVDVVEIYDVTHDTWLPGPGIPTKRGWHGAALVVDKIYVAGGKTIRTPAEKQESGWRFHFTSRDHLEMLDLATQTWSMRTPMPAGPRAGVAVVACAAKLWVIGGNRMRYRDETMLDLVEVYDPHTDTWAAGPSLPRPTQGPTVAVHAGRIYLTGGISDANPDRPCRHETYVLDPAVGRWEPLAPAPTARESSGVCVVGDRIYTFGGKDPQASAVTEIYEITTDRWYVDKPMPVAKAWLAACLARDRIFVMGGAYRLPVGYHWIDDLHEFVL
jgi:hypothetical protein